MRSLYALWFDIDESFLEDRDAAVVSMAFIRPRLVDVTTKVVLDVVANCVAERVSLVACESLAVALAALDMPMAAQLNAQASNDAARMRKILRNSTRVTARAEMACCVSDIGASVSSE